MPFLSKRKLNELVAQTVAETLAGLGAQPRPRGGFFRKALGYLAAAGIGAGVWEYFRRRREKKRMEELMGYYPELGLEKTSFLRPRSKAKKALNTIVSLSLLGTTVGMGAGLGSFLGAQLLRRRKKKKR